MSVSILIIKKQISWNTDFTDKLTAAGSVMLWTPQPANGHYSKVNESCPQLPTYSFNIHFNNILPSVPGFSNRPLSFTFIEQNFESTFLLYMSHAPPTYHEEYQIWSSSLCNLSIFGPHTRSETHSVCRFKNHTTIAHKLWWHDFWTEKIRQVG